MTNDEKINYFSIIVWTVDFRYLIATPIINLVPDEEFSQVAGTKKLKGNNFEIRFNPNKLKDNNHLIHVALHELGHIEHWVDVKDDLMSEYLAESWALLIAKEFFPFYYPSMLNRTIENVKSITHAFGYYEALRSIGEWKE